MKEKIWIILAIISWIFLIWWWYFLKYKNEKILEKNEQLETNNNLLNSKIIKLTNWSKDFLVNLKNFYQEFFKKKFDLYVVDLWWITEYVSPSNSFVKSVSFSKWVSIKYIFRNDEISNLLKIKKNIQILMKEWIITDYKMSDIKLASIWNNKSLLWNNNYYYETVITMNPTSDKEKIRNFLSNHDKFYKSIYSKFVFNEVEEVMKKWYEKVFRNKKVINLKKKEEKSTNTNTEEK